MSALPATKFLNLLLIEDDDIDVMAVRRGLRMRGVPHTLTVAHDGREGLAILRGDRGAAALGRPYLILLDLNLPVMNGLEFLRELRKDPAHKSALVFVLTTSNADEDRGGAYAYNIAGYVLKSELGHDFQPMLELIDSYCDIVRFP